MGQRASATARKRRVPPRRSGQRPRRPPRRGPLRHAAWITPRKAPAADETPPPGTGDTAGDDALHCAAGGLLALGRLSQRKQLHPEEGDDAAVPAAAPAQAAPGAPVVLVGGPPPPLPPLVPVPSGRSDTESSAKPSPALEGSFGAGADAAVEWDVVGDVVFVQGRSAQVRGLRSARTLR